ncbi:MAG: iron ABC transporter permease [Anaerolineales bacterium]|nr:iron ABC transporter permease [Anaerolineales bacterium]
MVPRTGRRVARPHRVRRGLLTLLYLAPLLFLALFYVYPLLAIFQASFSQPGAFTAIFAAILDPALLQLVWFTAWQAAVSTVVTVLAGLPLAYVFATYDFRGKSLLNALLTIPFVMPTVVVATAFLALLGRGGLVNETLQRVFGVSAPQLHAEQTLWIILLAHVFFNVAVVIRTVGGFWSNLNPHLREAAGMLGAPPARVFREITLPLLAPSLLSASLLIFLFTFTSFGVILLLGGPGFATIEVEIYRQAVNYFNLPIAAFLSVLQLLITFGVMIAYTRAQAQTSRTLRQQSAKRTARRPANWRQALVVAVCILLTVGALLAPLLALAWSSIRVDGAFSLRYYQALAENPRQSAFFVPPVTAIRNSLMFALATLVLSLPMGMIGAYMLAQPRTWLTALLEPLLLLPLGTSAVTLGFGYIIAMGELRTSLWLVPIAHTLIALPFVVRTLLPSVRALDKRLREAAAMLGASPARIWRSVDAPLLWRPLLIAAAFAFAISLGEFGATLLIARPDTPTMPMIIYRALGQPGALNYGQALAMSTVLMTVTGVALVLIEQFRLGDTEF